MNHVVMASFSSNVSELVSTSASPSTASVLQASTVVAKTALTRPTATLSPGHAAILEMHANSQSNALIYIGVVLGLYIFGMTIVIIKYVRGERYEARLTRLFQDLVQRDRFFTLSRRRSSQPKCTPVPDPNPEEEELPLSPIIQIPEIHLPPPGMEEESKV